MTSEDISEQINACLRSLPDQLEIGEIISLLCTIAAGYAEEEEGQYNMAPIQGIYFLESAMKMMIAIREQADENSSGTLH